jgi:hypothetical protein
VRVGREAIRVGRIMGNVGDSVTALEGHRGKANRGRRLPAARKVERDRAIVADRARGLTWRMIAQRHGVQERQARRIYQEWRDANLETQVAVRDAREWLFDLIIRYEEIIAGLALVAAEADNDAARVGALKAQMAGLDRLTELLVIAGLLPQNPRLEIEMRDAVEKVASVVGRIADGEVPASDVRHEVLALLSSSC